MATSQINRIVEHLRHTVLARDGANLSDSQLLDCFIARREELAFEILVRRHGPMVLSACRRVVGNHHDAEDAFQATFLVLVRKAASIQPRELVGNWLYGVAYQTAVKAKTIAAKRGAREKQVTRMPEAEAVTQDVWHEMQPLLDQELSRLSDKYRVPIVLCDLEGKTRKEAAQHLGVPEGTISSRLARARTMLAKRLTRHGVTLSAGALASVLTQQAAAAYVPATLVATTVKAGGAFAFGGVVSAKVAVLTEGVLKAMLMTKLKSATALFLLLGIIAVGGGLFTRHHTAAAVSPVERTRIAAAAEQAAQKKGVKNEIAALEGTWKVIRLERNGVEAKEKATVVIKGNKFTIEFEGGKPRTSTFKIDPSKKPKWFDDVPEGSAAWPGIYELKGDTLRICFDTEGALKRPSEFKTTPKSGFALFVLERDKGNLEKTDARLLGSWQARSVKGDMEKTPWPLNTTEGMTFSKATNVRSQPLPPRVLIEMTNRRAMELDYALSTTGNQKGIDFISIPPGGSKAEAFPGIYQIDGDTLKICLSQPNQPRPTDFDFKRGNKRVHIVLTRPSLVIKERQKFAGTWRLVSLEADGKKASEKKVEEALRVKMKWLADEEGRKLNSNPFLEPRMQFLVAYDSEGNWKQQTQGDATFTFMNCEGASAVDPAKKPRTIDCTVTRSGNLHAVQNEGEKRGQIKRGIYEFVDEDTYRICFAAPGKDRPADFAAKADSWHIVWVMQRVKKADEAIVREIDLKGYRGEVSKNDFAKPVVITNANELFKAFPNQNVGFPDREWREKIAGQVDFKKEHLLYFAWTGSGGDKMLIRGEKTKQVIFRRQPGVTNDEKPHIHLYAISKEASWSIETGVQAPGEKPNGNGGKPKEISLILSKASAEWSEGNVVFKCEARIENVTGTDFTAAIAYPPFTSIRLETTDKQGRKLTAEQPYISVSPRLRKFVLKNGESTSAKLQFYCPEFRKDMETVEVRLTGPLPGSGRRELSSGGLRINVKPAAKDSPMPPEDKPKKADPDPSVIDMAVKWPGASVEEMERLVIQLELGLAQMPGVTSIRTRSQGGRSQLRVALNLP